MIHIAWEWIWDETDDTTEGEKSTKASTSDHVNPYIHSDSDPSGDEVEDGSPLIHPTHTVMFKCVGLFAALCVAKSPWAREGLAIDKRKGGIGNAMLLATAIHVSLTSLEC